MDKKTNKAINVMFENLRFILKDNIISVYIYGSCCLDDFKLGWSDIDILVLTKNSLDNETAKNLLNLRQKLLEKMNKIDILEVLKGQYCL